jgi:hypothetical protein
MPSCRFVFLCLLFVCLVAVPPGNECLLGDQCLRGISAYGGSVPTGDQRLRGISAYGGSVPTGDQCLSGISAYGGCDRSQGFLPSGFLYKKNVVSLAAGERMTSVLYLASHLAFVFLFDRGPRFRHDAG